MCALYPMENFFWIFFFFFFQKEVQEFEQIIYCTHQTTARTLNSNYNLIQPDIILKHYKHSTKIREKKNAAECYCNKDWRTLHRATEILFLK